jgi:hypothetical protein
MDDLPEIDESIVAEFGSLGARADELVSVVRELRSRLRAEAAMHNMAAEEAAQLHNEIAALREQHVREMVALKRERDSSNRRLAMVRADLEHVAGVSVNSLTALRRREAQDEPLRGRPRVVAG